MREYRLAGSRWRIRVDLRRWLARMECIERLGGRCVRCGYASDLRALQFDHVDPSMKIKNISAYLASGWAKGGGLKPYLLAELQKCQLLCATCHAIKTVEDFDAVA